MRYSRAFLKITFSIIAGASISHAEPIRVGVLADVSGVTARVGEDCRRGYELASDNSVPKDAANPRLEIVFGDNQNDAKVGLSEFRRMIDVEHVAAVVTTRSHIAMSLANTSQQRHVPILAIASHPALLRQNAFAFRFIASANKDGETLAHTALALGYKKIAVVTLNDEAYLASSNAFKDGIAARSQPAAISLELNPDETAFQSLITRLKSVTPDAIYVNLGIGQIGPFIRKLDEAGWKGQLFSNFLLTTPDVRHVLGPLVEGGIFTESERGGSSFERLYRTKFEMEPSQLSYACFVAVSALVQASFADATIATPDDMFKALAGISNVAVPDGEVKIVNREADIKSAVYRVVGTSAVKLEVGLK